MPKLELFVAPNTCAIVPTIALEAISVPYSTHLVRLAKNEQNDPDYLKLNPKGKVPTLLIDEAPLSENPAILTWLHNTFPSAKLMPEQTSEIESAQHLSDLIFFSSTVHPAVAQVAMPFRFFPDKTAAFEQLRPMAIKSLNKIFATVEARLANGPWWFGEAWSIVDAYLLWTYRRVAMIGFSMHQFPNLAQHSTLCLERPPVRRAIEREQADIDILRSEGLYRAPV